MARSLVSLKSLVVIALCWLAFSANAYAGMVVVQMRTTSYTPRQDFFAVQTIIEPLSGTPGSTTTHTHRVRSTAHWRTGRRVAELTLPNGDYRITVALLDGIDTRFSSSAVLAEVKDELRVISVRMEPPPPEPGKACFETYQQTRRKCRARRYHCMEAAGKHACKKQLCEEKRVSCEEQAQSNRLRCEINVLKNKRKKKQKDKNRNRDNQNRNTPGQTSPNKLPTPKKKLPRNNPNTPKIPPKTPFN